MVSKVHRAADTFLLEHTDVASHEWEELMTPSKIKDHTENGEREQDQSAPCEGAVGNLVASLF